MTDVRPQDKVFGTSLLGLIVSAPLYGITCGQIYVYYAKYSGNDRWSTKFIVALIWALESFHLALVATMIYHYTINSWGDVSRLNRTTWTLEVQIVVALSVTFVAQLFFARLIWRYSKNWILTGIIVLLSLIHLGSGVVFMGHGFRDPLFTPKRPKIVSILSCTSLSIGIACDTLILVSMCYYLNKSRTGFRGTNTMINLLITYMIKTCLVTTIFSVICLVTFITLPDSLIYQPCYFIGSKLYASSLLSTLNVRESIRGKGQQQGCKTISSPMFTTIIDDGVSVTELMEKQLCIEGDDIAQEFSGGK